MTANTITRLTDPRGFSPAPLTDILRSGARRLNQQAVEAELSALLENNAADKTDDGRQSLLAAMRGCAKPRRRCGGVQLLRRTYGVKSDKAVAKLAKDHDRLLAFYDFPVERAQVLANTS